MIMHRPASADAVSPVEPPTVRSRTTVSAVTSTPTRAAACRAFGEPLPIENLHLAAPKSGQVQVRVLASAVCHSDIHFFDGAWGVRLPAVWGHEAAGVVEIVGDGVSEISVGDHVVITLIKSCGSCRNCQAGVSVACTGELTNHPTPLSAADGNPVAHGLGTAAFADRAVVDQSQIVVIHPEMAMEPASLLACGVITGVGAATNTAKIEAGASVVVIGTGGVGLNAVQGALNHSILGSKMGTSTIAIDIPELISKYQNGELLLDELITRTYPLDDINEAIDSVKNGQALRNVIVFEQTNTAGAD